MLVKLTDAAGSCGWKEMKARQRRQLIANLTACAVLLAIAVALWEIF